MTWTQHIPAGYHWCGTLPKDIEQSQGDNPELAEVAVGIRGPNIAAAIFPNIDLLKKSGGEVGRGDRTQQVGTDVQPGDLCYHDGDTSERLTQIPGRLLQSLHCL